MQLCNCVCILRARNNEGDYEREQKMLQQICCRLCLFILLDNRKEGLDVRGGRSPNWVNHVYLRLSDFMCFVCLYFPHILCVSLLYNIYFSNNWYQSRRYILLINSQERRVPSSSGSNGRRWQV